jgi:hypothetical protein
MGLNLNISSDPAGSFLAISSSQGSNLLIKPPPSKTIWAGTSPEGLLLTSNVIIDSGTTPTVKFRSLGTKDLGNITVMDKYFYNDVLYICYVTDTGYFVNYTLDTSVQVSNYSITSFNAQSYWMLLIGDSIGGNYRSMNGGATWSSRGFNLGGNQVNASVDHAFPQ